MTDQPGLFELPERTPAPTRPRADRGRRGEHWTRTVTADLHVVDADALRDAAHRRLSAGLVIELGPIEAGTDADDPDLLDPYEEILTSDAAAVRWWVEPTTGVCPELAEALRVEAIRLDATDEGQGRVWVRWALGVQITDVRLLREHAQRIDEHADLPEMSFAEVWNTAADPCAPLTGLPGVTSMPATVEISRTRTPRDP